MWYFFYFLLLMALMLLVRRSLNWLKQQTNATLQKILYEDINPQLFLQLLENPKLKILYTKSTLTQLRIDAYMLSDDDTRCEAAFKQLETTKQNRSERILYLQKKLSYYCSKGYNETAKEALNSLAKLVESSTNEHDILLLNESIKIYQIYIEHNLELLPQLIESSAKQTGRTKGMTLYYIAKLYYYQQNYNEVSKYLEESVKLLQSSYWGIRANNALKDFTNLQYK